MSSFLLKLIAVLTMLMDHVGAVLFPEVMWMRIIGRISFPIFCFLLSEGYFHTHNLKKYLLRLGIFALISEVPFDLAFFGSWWYPYHNNVFLTLLLGLLVLALPDAIENSKLKQKWQKEVLTAVSILGCFFLGEVLHTDYGAFGVILIAIFGRLGKNKFVSIGIAALFLAICFFGSIEMYGLIGLGLCLLYNGKKGPRFNKYIFYGFYPVHLLLLWIVSQWLE